MNFEMFVQKIKECSIYINTEKDLDLKSHSNNKYFCIMGEACIGGTSGGSCWDDGENDHHYDYTNKEGYSDCDNELKQKLNNILTIISPTMTFLQYDNLIRGLIKEKEYTNYEYYGNSSDHLIRYIILQELYDKLIEMSLI